MLTGCLYKRNTKSRRNSQNKNIRKMCHGVLHQIYSSVASGLLEGWSGSGEDPLLVLDSKIVFWLYCEEWGQVGKILHRVGCWWEYRWWLSPWYCLCSDYRWGLRCHSFTGGALPLPFFFILKNKITESIYQLYFLDFFGNAVLAVYPHRYSYLVLAFLASVDWFPVWYMDEIL